MNLTKADSPELRNDLEDFRDFSAPVLGQDLADPLVHLDHFRVQILGLETSAGVRELRVDLRPLLVDLFGDLKRWK